MTALVRAREIFSFAWAAQPPHEYKHFQRLYDSGMLLRFQDLGEVGIKRGISSFGQTCWQWKTYMRRANIDFI
jgi:hypothetical protein